MQPAKRRRASAWAEGNAATKSNMFRMPSAQVSSKATVTRPTMGEGGTRPAGCTTSARATLGRHRNLGGPVSPRIESGGTGTR
jgi:hypothetical protein